MSSSLADYFKRQGATKNKKEDIAAPSGAKRVTRSEGSSSRSALTDYFSRQKDERLGVKKYAQQDDAYKSWMDEVAGFSDRLVQDANARAGKYQPKEDFRTYRDTSYITIAELLRRGYDMRAFYTQKGDEYDSGYGENTSKDILDGIGQNINFLMGARSALRDESSMWDNFASEDEYNTAKKHARWASLPDAADFEENSAYKTTANGKKTDWNAFANTYNESGYGDLLYDYINGDPEAQARQSRIDKSAGGYDSAFADSHSGWAGLPEETVKTFNYIYATESPEAAYEYINAVSDKGMTGMSALALNALNSMGVFSAGAAAEKAVNALSGKADEPSRFATDMLTEVVRAQEQHPTASKVGSVGGTLMLMSNIAKGVGTIPGFTSLPGIAQSALSGALSMGGTTAVQELGGALAGAQDWKDYGLDVLTSVGAGAASGGVARGIGAAGNTLLQRFGLTQNMLARTVAAGFAGAGGAAARSGIRQGSTVLRGGEFDSSDLLEEALVGFAFSSISYLTRNFTASPSSAAAQDEGEILANKYFKGMTKEQAKAEYRRLSRMYHPDLHMNDTAEAQAAAEATMKEINMAWSWINATSGAQFYQDMQKAQRSGDTDSYQSAKNGFDDSVTAIVELNASGAITGQGAQDAVAILEAISKGGAVAPIAPEVVIAGNETTTPDVVPVVSPDAQAALQQAAAEMTQAEELGTVDAALKAAEAADEVAKQGGDLIEHPKESEVAIEYAGDSLASPVERPQESEAGVHPVEIETSTAATQEPEEWLNFNPDELRDELARRAANPDESPVGDMLAVAEAEQEHQFPNGRKVVEDFAKDLSPAMSATLREMYDETQEPAAYLENMMKAHKAGVEGISDPKEVFGQELENSHITLPQFEAARLVGQNESSASSESPASGGYDALVEGLSRYSRVDQDGMTYTVSKIGDEYVGLIQETQKAESPYRVENARAVKYRSQPQPTREAAVQDLLAVAQNSFYRGASTKEKLRSAFEEGGIINDDALKDPKTLDAVGRIFGADTGRKPSASNGTAQRRIADDVANYLQSGETLTANKLFEIANHSYGGTMAEGAYSIKDAYDGMELGVNQYLMSADFVKRANGDAATAVETVKKLVKILSSLPTQGNKRTEEMQTFQQFSTPPNIAYLAAWVANITDGDVILEPSAGIGGLALWGKAWGATVYGNELSTRRLEFLKELGLDGVFNLNAEQIDNLLPENIKPTVVIMNPPFSATAGRTSTNKTTNAKRHIEQALERLEDGGRLVAILGKGMADDTPTFKQWWNELRSKYSVPLNIRIDGENYRKYGTTWDVQLVVIDKTGPHAGAPTVTGEYKDLNEIPKILEVVRDGREVIEVLAGVAGTEQKPTVARVQKTAITTEAGAALPAASTVDGTGRVEAAGRLSHSTGELQRVGEHEVSGGRASSGAKSETGIQNADNKRRAGRGNVGQRNVGAAKAGDGNGESTVGASGHGGVQPGGQRIQLVKGGNSKRVSAAEPENPDSVYATYSPKKVHIEGAKPHPARLVESAAMAAVEPPDVTYTPALPASIATNGVLSDAQLENVVYAGQAHSQILEDGCRKGYFIGDGTGVGKGRQISGIIMDNFLQGRDKAVWISAKSGLINDAKRDWKDLGGNPDDIFDMAGTKILKSGISRDSGILFAPYTTLRSNSEARLKMLTDWLGEDFDGVIAFDEAHTMKSNTPIKGKRGKTKPSEQALAGIALQRAFPKARIVYASATGATKVENYGYLERLGLWGKGTAFANKEDFISKISSGGLAAMELVARDMKAMGVYMARSISYDDVKYDTIQHNLTPMQKEIYNSMSRAWQKVFQSMMDAADYTEGGSEARRRVKTAVYGGQQRFYNQILTSMSMPTVIEDIRKELDAGHSCVIQLTNTNESQLNRSLEKNAAEGGDLDDLDLTPSDMLIELVQNSFPVVQHETVEDDEGNEFQKPVIGPDGKPVLNRQAVKARDLLIDELKMMKVPDGALEMLFDAFGVDEVAEITGRSRRVVEKKDEHGHMKRVVEIRSSSARTADAQAFQDGQKHILVFSQAGGTGFSFHADLRGKNQQQRIHYLLQAGWQADEAVQGFGRTHRSNQASAPVVRLVTTDAMGQKRFTSTIARRLDQLGALTKGQRQAGSGVFGEKDNLENPIASDALAVYYKQLFKSSPEVLEKLGLLDALTDKETGGIKETADALRQVSTFLNRILALEVDEQNEIFQGFYDTFERAMDVAIAQGTVDMGLENYKADRIEVVDEKVVREDPSGANTVYMQMRTYHKPLISTLGQVKAQPRFQGLVKLDDGSVRAVYEISTKTNEKTGEVQRRFKLEGPVRGKSSVYVENTLKEKTTKLDKKEWAEAWKNEVARAPEYAESTLHLLTGTLLPIWDRLPTENTRVMRVLTVDGKQYLGRVIQADQIDGILRSMGVNRTKETFTPAQISDAVLGKDREVVFRDNRLRITRRRVSGEWRMELAGQNIWWMIRQYPGIISERIGSVYRYFIPTGERGEQLLDEIMKLNPVVDVRERGTSDDEVEYSVESQSGSTPVGQLYQSADTSIPQVPGLFKDKNAVFGAVNIDIGGGRFDLATNYLAERGTSSFVFDPFNRDEATNRIVVEFLQGGHRADTATCANVLNVIREPEARANVILEMAKSIKPDGIAYFTVYEGDGSGVSGETTKGWQNRRKTEEYMEEIRKYFRGVKRKGKLIIATEPKNNLPKAAWELKPGKAVMYSREAGAARSKHPDEWTTSRVGNKDKSPLTLPELFEKLRHDFGFNITKGHVRGAGVRGQFNTRDKGIRTKLAQDLPVACHELGHALDDKYGLTADLTATEKNELLTALGDLGASYKASEKVSEGLAEYMRKFLTNSVETENKYPAFTDKLKKSVTPEDLTRLEMFADEVNAFLSLSADTATGAIHLREDRTPDARGLSEKAKDAIHAFRQAWIDSNEGIKRFDRETGADTYTLATNAAYADAIAARLVTGDLTDQNGRYVAPGLRAALDGLNIKDKETYRLFGEYLIVKHGPERLAEDKRVFANDAQDNPVWMAQRQAAIEAEHPEFEAISDRLYQFQRNFLRTWGVDTGLVSSATADEWEKRWEYYVPFNRFVAEDKRGLGAKRGFANQNSTIRRARGSGLDFLHPVDNIITNMVRMVNAGVRNNVMRAITTAALSEEGGDATFIEKIPTPIKQQGFSIASVKEDLLDFIEGSDAMDMMSQAAMVEKVASLDDILYQYGRGKAGGNVITVLSSGEPQFWKVNDPLLLESITNMTTTRMPWLLEQWRKITRLQSAFITGTNLIWSVTSNAPRDLQTMLMYSDTKNPLKLLHSVGLGYVNRVKDARGKAVDPLYAEFLAMGGGQESFYTADRNLAKVARRKLSGKRSKNPFDAIAFVADTIETGPRFAAYRLARMKGLSAQEAIYISHDITVNFRRKGTKASGIMAISPFINASIQGADKHWRYYTAEDKHGKGTERTKTAAARWAFYAALAAGIGALTVAINLGDDEHKKYYGQLSGYTKNNYYVIPINDEDGSFSGRYVAIPKGRDTSMLISFAQRLMEYTAGENDDAFEGFYEYWTDNGLPNIVGDLAQGDLYGAVGSLSGVGTAVDIFANRDFLGRPIVSNALADLPKEQQYTGNTSKVAYYLGQALHMSPQQIDYVLTQMFGYVGKYAKALAPVDGDKQDLTLGVKNQFVKDAQYSTDIVNRLYDRAAQTDTEKNGDPENMDKAIEASMDDRMKRFYSRYNNLARNAAETTQTRVTRQTVLDMVDEYLEAADGGFAIKTAQEVFDVVKRDGSTELLPSVMQSWVKDANDEKHTLSAVEYVEFQTDYNRLYWEYAENNLPSATSEPEKRAVLRAAKQLASDNAKRRALERIGAPSEADKFEGISDEDIITFAAQKDLANDDGGFTQAEAIDIIKEMVDNGLSKEAAYTLFRAANSAWTDKNNPWKRHNP